MAGDIEGSCNIVRWIIGGTRRTPIHHPYSRAERGNSSRVTQQFEIIDTFWGHQERSRGGQQHHSESIPSNLSSSPSNLSSSLSNLSNLVI